MFSVSVPPNIITSVTNARQPPSLSSGLNPHIWSPILDPQLSVPPREFCCYCYAVLKIHSPYQLAQQSPYTNHTRAMTIAAAAAAKDGYGTCHVKEGIPQLVIITPEVTVSC